jgi:uncharacterized protein YbjT (DUF2867 family)
MFVILGVSGNVGSVVASTLLDQHKPVRVVVRDAAKGEAWKARGAEVAIADVGDATALTRAFTGATGVFALLPPDMTTPDLLASNRKRAESIAKAVKDAKVGHVVLLSSSGAQHEAGTGPIRALHAAEKLLGATGAALTAVRASSFIENWLMSLSTLPQGFVPTFFPPDLAYPQIATTDIGKVVAAALVEGGRGTRVIDVTGPRELSSNDVAAALSAITGKTIVAKQMPLDAVVPMYTSFGVSESVASNFREMYEGAMRGLLAPVDPASVVRGTVGFDEVLRQHVKA